jgi:hypothetical protein
MGVLSNVGNGFFDLGNFVSKFNGRLVPWVGADLSLGEIDKNVLEIANNRSLMGSVFGHKLVNNFVNETALSGTRAHSQKVNDFSWCHALTSLLSMIR